MNDFSRLGGKTEEDATVGCYLPASVYSEITAHRSILKPCKLRKDTESGHLGAAPEPNPSLSITPQLHCHIR